MSNIKRVLVTGGFGYVGSRLTPLLLENGCDVTVIDLCLYGHFGLQALEAHENFYRFKNGFKFIEADIRDPKELERALDGIEAVIHLAAISNDPTGEIDEVLTRQVNFDAVGVLLSSAKKSGVKRFINGSSSSVFGVKDVADVTEALEPEPITYYSKYKMLSEWLVLTASDANFVTVNIRPATICGFSPRQRFDLTVNKLTADAVRKRVITVHGGEQRRPNLGITDMINLYKHLLEVPGEKINGKTFNFGFENLKVIEIAKIVESELQDLNVEIKITETLDKRDYHISSQKILSELKYKPISSIRKEIQELKSALMSGIYPDIENPRFYNMKMMNLKRNNSAYSYLSR